MLSLTHPLNYSFCMYDVTKGGRNVKWSISSGGRWACSGGIWWGFAATHALISHMKWGRDAIMVINTILRPWLRGSCFYWGGASFTRMIQSGAWWKTRSGHRWFILYLYIPDEVSSSGSVWFAKLDISSSSPEVVVFCQVLTASSDFKIWQFNEVHQYTIFVLVLTLLKMNIIWVAFI